MFRDPQVVLLCSDLPATAAFYAGLGFVEVFRTPPTGEAIHLDLALDGYRVGLATAASTRDDHGLDPVATGQRAVVVLWTDDVVGSHRRLVEAGAPDLAGPHVWLRRLLIAWVADPDGHAVQLVQPLGPLLHLARASDWATAQQQGEYRVSTLAVALAEQGFVHLSFPHQLAAVAEARYRDVADDLVVLEIDPLRVDADVVVEPGDAAPGAELFPHLYGALPVAAVVAVRRSGFDDDGRFVVEGSDQPTG